MFLKLAEKLGPVFRDLARQKECEILEGSTMSDHVHMCIAIPPKHSVASIIGFMKGKNGTALQFDGKDDYVSVPNNSSLNIADNITIEAWINLPSLPVDTNVGAVIVEKYSSLKGFFLSVRSTGKLHFRPHNGTASQGWDSASSISVGEWYHVVAVISGSNGYTYINGQHDGGRSDLSYMLSDVATLDIGKWSNVNFPFNGVIDEVRIYNRALTEAEVKYHYNRGGPVAYWAMDEGSGSVINEAKVIHRF